MKGRTRALLKRRRHAIRDFGGIHYAHDFIQMPTILLSKSAILFSDNLETHLKKIEARKRWLRRTFPDEEWLLPLLTIILVGEACRCYVEGIFFATVAMCQATAESLLRRVFGGTELHYYKLIGKAYAERKITDVERRDLSWLSSIRNPTLHTGRPAKYARALSRALFPVIYAGKPTEKALIEQDSKRALKTVISLLHHLCEVPGGFTPTLLRSVQFQRSRHSTLRQH